MKFEKLVKKDSYKLGYNLEDLCKIIDNQLIFSNFKLILRRIACGNPNPKKKEYTYFRVLEKNGERCIQFIIFYQWQYFPPHKHDYHPFNIYLDENSNVKYLIYDKGHHRSKILYPTNEPLIFSIFMPDHHFTTEFKSYYITFPFKCSYKPLKPSQIIYFWKINNMAQLKLRTKLIDPWDPDIKNTFRDEVRCPYCNSTHLFDFMHVKDNQLFLEVECKTHKFLATYDIKKQIFSANKI